MPKVRKERKRRHAKAAGNGQGRTNATLAAVGGVDNVRRCPFTGLAMGTASNAKPAPSETSKAMMDSLMDTDAAEGEATATATTTATTTATATATATTPALAVEVRKEKERKTGWGVKQLSKKDKMRERRQKFRSRLFMPGDTAKFEETGMSNMASLSDMLPSAEESTAPKIPRQQQAAHGNMTSHMRQANAMSEIDQFSNVITHPAFQNDPIAALRAHMTNTYSKEKVEREHRNQVAGIAKQKVAGIAKQKVAGIAKQQGNKKKANAAESKAKTQQPRKKQSTKKKNTNKKRR